MIKAVKVYIKDNLKYMIPVVVFLIGGITLGAYTSFQYDQDAVKRTGDFFASVFALLKNGVPDAGSVFTKAFFNSLKITGSVWLLGFTVIGAAIILLIVMKCGFMMGYASSFLIRFFAFKGIAASVICVFSQCLFFIPALFFVSAEAMKLSGMLFSMITGKIRYRVNFKSYMIRYSFYLAAAVFAAAVYSASEAYIGASLLRLFVGK